MQLRMVHLTCSVFITLLVGVIHTSEISKMVACLSNPVRQIGMSLEILVSFSFLDISIFTITRVFFTYYCVRRCVGDTDCLFCLQFFYVFWYRICENSVV